MGFPFAEGMLLVEVKFLMGVVKEFQMKRKLQERKGGYGILKNVELGDGCCGM